MPRLIILLLTLASLTLVTVQNLGEDKAVRFVVLGTPLSSIPLGLLLLCAVGTGALTTSILYGLVGLHRPANSAKKSKYQPMGSRVPYPESSSPNTPQTDAGYSTTTTRTAYSSGSTAFVTEPPANKSAASQTFVDKAGTSQTEKAPSTATPTSSSNAANTQSGSSSGSPATSSNVYSPFSRDKDATQKKKGPTAQ